METVTRRWRQIGGVVLAAAVGSASASADGMDEWEKLLGELEDPEEFLELMLEPPAWLVLPSVRVGGGYRDNVLLAEVGRQGGWFTTWGFDTLFASPPDSTTVFHLLLTADHHRFYPSDRFSDEFFGFANTRLETKVAPASTFLLGADVYYVRQRVDITTVEILEAGRDPLAIDMIGGGATGRLGWRQEICEAFSATAGYAAGWHDFRSPLEDYRELGPKIELAWNPRPGVDAALALEHVRRNYDGRAAREASGETIEGSSLRFDLWRADLTGRRHWRFDHGRFTAAPRLGVEVNRDNGGRYFDYVRWRAGQRIEYAPGPWRFAARGGISYFEYDRQTAGNGRDSPRRRWPWEWEIEMSRKLTETARAHVRFEREGASGNQAVGRYRVNTVQTGVQWEF